MNKQIVEELINWIKKYVTNANANGVVVGMSGGKDSLVVAKLCTLALGKENVFGLIMPNGKMKDLSDAVASCNLLNIRYETIDISPYYNAMLSDIKKITPNNLLTDITTINTAPRLRMTTLYALAGSLNYLVANTSNLSEAMVGYTTKWGDNVGDFAPLLNFTKTEVCEIGLLLGLPNELVNKTPADGLSTKTDEEKLGFSYAELDEFIRNGTKSENFNLILSKHNFSKHKRNGIISFENNFENAFYNKEK